MLRTSSRRRYDTSSASTAKPGVWTGSTDEWADGVDGDGGESGPVCDELDGGYSDDMVREL